MILTVTFSNCCIIETSLNFLKSLYYQSLDMLKLWKRYFNPSYGITFLNGRSSINKNMTVLVDICQTELLYEIRFWNLDQDIFNHTIHWNSIPNNFFSTKRSCKWFGHFENIVLQICKTKINYNAVFSLEDNLATMQFTRTGAFAI